MADGEGQSGHPWERRDDPRAQPRDGVSLGKGDGEQGQGQQPQQPPQSPQSQGGQGEQAGRGGSVAEQPTITSPTGPGTGTGTGTGTGAGPPPVPPAPGGPAAQQYGQQANPYAGPYGQQPYTQQPGPYGQQQYGGPQPSPYAGPGAGYGYTTPPVPPGYGAGYGWGQQLPTGKSVAAMVLGIIGLVLVAFCWTSFIAILVAPVALGLGLSARRQADRGEIGGRGQAVAGFVMGIVGTVLAAVVIAILILGITLADDSDPGPGGDSGSDGSSIDARGPAVTLLVGD
jgi:hypothetical protein